jgi:hypothetical protein
MKIKKLLLIFLIFLFVQNAFCEETMNAQNEDFEIEQIQIEKIELEQVESKKNKSKTNEDFSLFEIDKLIRATEYDKALKQLKIYIEKNPLKFDLAQSRIKKIMKARQNYSELANRLIQLIQTDPGNDKEIYEITTTLESFEKNPSDENLKFIADLKKSAEFNYFRAMFMQIQEEAALLAKQGQYTEAVTKIKDGFWLYKEEFYTKWQNDQNVIAQVNEILKNIDNLLSQFCDNGFQKKLTDSVDSFVKSVSYGNYENSLEKFNESVVYFNKLQTLIAGFIEAENQLQGIFENLQKIDNDTSDASFIPFVSRFITGLSSVERSGILGALETQWQININKMTVALAQNTSELYKDYSMSFNKSVFKNKSVINSEKSKRERNVIKNNYNLVEKIYNLDLTVYGKFERYNGSVVAVDGQAYLFTAKSGTGKSTHTRFWRETFGDRAVMVNDDKPFLRITEDGVLAYGSPWNGKHKLGNNICVPLKAICILERGEENQIQAISGQEASMMLFQQSNRPMDPRKMPIYMDLIDQLSKKTEFYRMQCNLDPNAAQVAFDAMSK